MTDNSLTKEQKLELIRKQMKDNQFHWGVTNLILCKDCISIFNVRYNNEKSVKCCPLCESQNIIPYTEFNFKGLEGK